MAQPTAITAQQLKQLLDAPNPPRLIDVREPAEWEIVRIPGAVLIPKGELPSKLAELPQNRPVIAYCKTGIRSAEALALLKNAGFSDAKHVQGGVTAWATQVDKSQPVY